MYIPIIIISSAIDAPEASPIIDDKEDMDEGAVNERVGEEEVIEVTDGEFKDKEIDGAMDKGIGNEEYDKV
uniref:Uncharacterized protein n=1 Tax=Amphimedon queenslandica TaxID=400682 RepID=A0A1X7TCD2_AMPQE